MESSQKRRPKFNYGLSLKSFDFILIREGSQNFSSTYIFAYFVKKGLKNVNLS